MRKPPDRLKLHDFLYQRDGWGLVSGGEDGDGKPMYVWRCFGLDVGLYTAESRTYDPGRAIEQIADAEGVPEGQVRDDLREWMGQFDRSEVDV